LILTYASLQRDALASAHLTPAELIEYAPDADSDDIHAVSRKTLPHWLSQPHWRANSSAKAKREAAEIAKAKELESKDMVHARLKAKLMSRPGASATTVPDNEDLAPAATCVPPPVGAAAQKALRTAASASTVSEREDRLSEVIATVDVGVDAGDLKCEYRSPLLSFHHSY
jgi:hypothetical protein